MKYKDVKAGSQEQIFRGEMAWKPSSVILREPKSLLKATHNWIVWLKSNANFKNDGKKYPLVKLE